MNAVKIKNINNLRRIDESLDSLGDITVFSALDAFLRYWRIPILDSDCDKTAITCNYSLH